MDVRYCVGGGLNHFNEKILGACVNDGVSDTVSNFQDHVWLPRVENLFDVQEISKHSDCLL